MIGIAGLQVDYAQPEGGQRRVLDLREFSVPRGGQVCLCGGSGSGKTTLLNVIAGVTPPTRGRVVVADTELHRLGESARDRFRAERIGYVFQTFNLLQGFSARDNVALPAAFARKRDARPRAERLLRRLGVEHRSRARPAQLSVGEQQRVALARALVNDPDVVLADEPTANLDAENRDHVLELLREVCEERGTTLLLVTHEAEVQARFDQVQSLEELRA